MDDEAVVTYKGLREEYGIILSRTHIARLQKTGKFPKRFKPFEHRGSHFYYKRRDIRSWLNSR